MLSCRRPVRIWRARSRPARSSRYLWSVTGLGYNTAMLDRALGAVAPRDTLAKLLERIQPAVRRYHSSQYINDLASGDICIALGYLGDVIQACDRAREAGSTANIAFRVPRQGAQMSIDMLAIPKDAPHLDNALRVRRSGDPRRPGHLSARQRAPAVLSADRGIARLRANAHARVEPHQIGLLRRRMALLELRAVEKRFQAAAAVDGVSLAVEAGEFFALLGPSGCGKTTLLRLIAGLERPDAGAIVIDGADMTAVPPYARPVNMMFQSYALFPHLDVAANISFGLNIFDT